MGSGRFSGQSGLRVRPSGERPVAFDRCCRKSRKSNSAKNLAKAGFGRIIAARLHSADTRVGGRFCLKRCGPSRLRARNASAVLEIFFCRRKRVFRQHRPTADNWTAWTCIENCLRSGSRGSGGGIGNAATRVHHTGRRRRCSVAAHGACAADAQTHAAVGALIGFAEDDPATQRNLATF